MFRVTNFFDYATAFDTTCTVDAAIQSARKLAKQKGHDLVVRDGQGKDAPIRVIVRAATFATGMTVRATWAVTCTACKGAGKTSKMVGAMGHSWASNDEICERCCLLGVVEDNPCQ